MRCLVPLVLFVAVTLALAADGPPALVSFKVQTDVILKELNKEFCWFHPRAAAIPGRGQNGGPAVILTIQKHLVADDHYSGLSFMRTDDLGKTWTKPDPRPELDWSKDAKGNTISVADVTPGWHAGTKRLIAIGTKVRYSPAGAQLLDEPRSQECAYAVFDPATDKWSKWQFLKVPESDSKFYTLCPGCVQWLVEPDGSVLIPMCYAAAQSGVYKSTVFKCKFDGETLAYLEHGDELALNEVRGLVEPSLTKFQGKFYLTIRNDNRGYVTTSDDGLHYKPLTPWTFDDSQDLGSYNTQQHWLSHSDGLFLTYTRRGANNDHIPRNRAPIFVAQVDPVKLQVIRSTEQSLIPERGVMLGNFGACAINEHESWVTDSEFIQNGQSHPRGADGSTFVARVLWSKPNRDAP